MALWLAYFSLSLEYIHMYTDLSICLKKPAHMVVEAGRVGPCAGGPGKSSCCSLCLKSVCRQNSLLLWGSESFVLIRLSTD